MICFLIYLLIGMMYSGLTFRKTLKFVINAQLTKDEIYLLKNDKETDEIKVKVAGVFLFVGIVSVAKILLYPFVIFTKLGKRSVNS